MMLFDKSCLIILIFLCFPIFLSAEYLDNGVDGEPDIVCGPLSIAVNFKTKKKFEGHVFVKGMYDQKNCRNDEIGKVSASIEIPFDMCNVVKTRSLNPKGIFVSNTIVISFHPKFITKTDKAYRIQCFYMENDKTVSTNIEVSDMTTISQNQDVPLPVCKYEILNGGPSGEVVSVATIGSVVYHKWSCESETVDTFCMFVHSCTVDDGNGEKIQIINENGCSIDKALVNNIEYTNDFVAGQLSNVYKYADKAQMFYQCQITVNIKELYQSCPRTNCSIDNYNIVSQNIDVIGNDEDDENIFNGTMPDVTDIDILKILKKRSILRKDNIMDVRTELTTFDMTPEEKNMFCMFKDNEEDNNYFKVIEFHYNKNMICFSLLLFIIIITVICFNFILLGIIFLLLMKKRYRQ
uniref:ZP domain-containing protein n=1 Tax=Parastrongyloides trichosuri TaxID=131310 RepID=A0A0N4ZC14_PARTI